MENEESERMLRYLEATTPRAPRWWWLSFADSDKPEGQQLLGIALIKATCHAHAVSEAWRLKCNPGGGVMGWECLDEWGEPAERWRNRLISDKSEVDEMSRDFTGAGTMTIAEAEAEGLS